MDQRPVGFYEKNSKRIKEISIILFILLFILIYSKVPVVNRSVGLCFNPIVKGMTRAYGKLSTHVHKWTGFRLGFVEPVVDPDFLFEVQVASFINERRASPLIDIGMDISLDVNKRVRALEGLLKFDSVEQWIRPFLNELYKGGLIQLDQQAPVLDELFKKIRSEGGIKSPLVSAYAEVVFDFMLQASDKRVRQRSLDWISDVVAPAAGELIVQRVAREQDPEIRTSIEKALWNIRSVSNPAQLREDLAPFYRRPPWPEVKVPIAVLLSRLGVSNTKKYVSIIKKDYVLTRDQEILADLALSGIGYPKKLKMTKQAQALVDQRKENQKNQIAWAKSRRQQILEASDQKDKMLEWAQEAKSTRLGEEKKEVPPKLAQILEDEIEPEQKIPEKMVKPQAYKKPAQVASVPVVPIPVEPKIVKEEVPVVKVEPKKDTPPIISVPKEVEQVPPQDNEAQMRPVDIVFEVKNEKVLIYAQPGDAEPTRESLSVGDRGKATFAVMVGNEKWVQVKSKQNRGWVRANLLSAYNLAPPFEGAGATKVVSKESKDDDYRDESTSFEIIEPDTPYFSEAKIGAVPTGKLVEGTPYLALKSVKVGTDRWFQIVLDSDRNKGWARGYELILSETNNPVGNNQGLGELDWSDGKSAFAAEWVVAGVKDVGVYGKPSISAKMIKKISPPDIFKVEELTENSFGEWYRIKLANGKEGWVQSMDVNLTRGD